MVIVVQKFAFSLLQLRSGFIEIWNAVVAFTRLLFIDQMKEDKTSDNKIVNIEMFVGD